VLRLQPSARVDQLPVHELQGVDDRLEAVVRELLLQYFLIRPPHVALLGERRDLLLHPRRLVGRESGAASRRLLCVSVGDWT
jgi:hypothetical protein